ncbi:Innexin inx2, partial [Cichlidogyrus casuarinus]
YYQWVPLVLGLQAIMYYLPRIVWASFVYNKVGTDLENLVKSAFNASKEEGQNREKTVKHVAKTLEVLVFNRREYRQVHNSISRTMRHTLSSLPGKRHGNNLVYMYLFIKVLYLLVGMAQLFIMYLFLRFDEHEGYFWFGFRILQDIINGKPWTETNIFPRVGMCRHEMKNVGSDNKIFAQCVLPINMLNEKIYVFLYFFFAAVLIMTALSIPLWIIRMGMKNRQRHFIRRFLKIADHYDRENPKQKAMIEKFVDEFLRQDGHFILRMLSMNAGDLITVEIVCHLFSDYQKQFMHMDLRGDPGVRTRISSRNHNKLADLSPPDYSADKSLSTATGDFMQGKLSEGKTATVQRRILPDPSAPMGEVSYPTEMLHNATANYSVSVHSDDSHGSISSKPARV